MAQVKILAVDVCGTLFEENTTAGFVRYHFRNFSNYTPINLLILQFLGIPLLRKLIIALGRITKRDYFRSGYIRLLKGEDQDRLNHSALQYAASLEEKRIVQVWRHIEDLRRDEWNPILVSNSLDIVVSAIAERYSLPWVASELTFSGGICDGHLKRDLRGRKALRVEE